MDSPENQERMSQERQQLEQTRDQVRRTSEALENEMVTQAAASGTRAEREFEELRNEFRRRASGRFNDQMRDMRETARELDRKEKDLAERLSPTASPEGKESAGKESDSDRKSGTGKKSLRDDDRGEQVAQGIGEQRQRLSNLVDRMKETIQEAEQTEPLLTERLYETARNVQNQGLDRTLEATGQSLKRGLLDDARQQERAAGKGIEKLREGVERAAEAVLGDEAESLRRAREELQELSRELNREIARNAPDGPQPREPRGATSRASSTPEARRPGDSPSLEEGDGGNGRQVDDVQPGERPSAATQNADESGEPQQGRQQSGGKKAGIKKSRERQPAGEQPGGQQAGQGQPGTEEQDGQQPGEGQAGGRQPGRGQNGQRQSGNQRGGGRESNDPRTAQGGRSGGNPNGARRLDGPAAPGDGPVDDAREKVVSPIAGNDFLNWSDRLRDVEEMVDDPELRAEAARIRDKARSIRAELKRHSSAPNWDLVRVQVAEPLAELSDRVTEELLRRNSRQAVVPLDRDPVPPRYSEKTRRYYEQLGSGK
jgi:hypothetical protein